MTSIGWPKGKLKPEVTSNQRYFPQTLPRYISIRLTPPPISSSSVLVSAGWPRPFVCWFADTELRSLSSSISPKAVRASVKQDGYTFDAGSTLITAPFLFDELWELAGKRREDAVEFVPIDPFCRIRFDSEEVFNDTGDATAVC